MRRAMGWETAFGFTLFFAVVAVIQAVLNVLRPDPEVWPALVALVFVTFSVITYRRWRQVARIPSTDS